MTLVMKKSIFGVGGQVILKYGKGSQKVKNVVFELVDQVRVAGLPPYFEDFEYS